LALVGLGGTICPHEFDDGGADLMGTAFSDEMGSVEVVSVGLGPETPADVVEAQRRSPVVQHQCDVVTKIQRVPQREQVVALFGVGSRSVCFGKVVQLAVCSGPSACLSFSLSGGWRSLGPVAVCLNLFGL
jgi:hypothetical protein